ncbi:hypothetical protein [Candidatus Ichthyocystis sparus]|uniref:hypothetical protein n=1 Tax=Candidatus Ichthyocystis sparus TaxID=1561004 RepID=UPI000B810257|nr:hypothetical protein [Candidatus Ichthyocystis sparus]
MCPVSATGAAFGDTIENIGYDGSNKDDVMQSGVSGSDFQQIEAPPATADTAISRVAVTVRKGGRARSSAKKRDTVSAVSSSATAASVGKGMSTTDKGKAPARKSATASTSTAIPDAVPKGVRGSRSSARKRDAVSAVSSSATAASVGKGMSTTKKGKAPVVKSATTSTSTAIPDTVPKGVRGSRSSARKSATAPACTASSDVFDSLGVNLHPDSAQIVNDLLLKVDKLAGRIYRGTVSKQFTSSVSGGLTMTGLSIWYNTYGPLFKVSFVYRCLREYHCKHRPVFIRSLPVIKVLSDFSGNDVETLNGDVLLSFLSKLDSAVRGMVEGIFNSNWAEVTGNVFSALEEGYLGDISCKDFIDVLGIAGLPSMVFSPVSYLKKQSSKTNTDSKDIGSCTAPGDGSSSSAPIAEGGHASSSSVSIPVSAHADTEIICVDVEEVSPTKCVDLLGLKFHPDSAEIICKLFSGLRESARTSCSCSIINYLLTAINSGLSAVGIVIWCNVYRELHLYSFVSKCLCIYHYKYRPSFVRVLPDIRILSSSSDCNLVPLSGDVLSVFLSKLDCAIRDVVESIFDYEWDEEAAKVFSKLEDGSLSNVSCEDIINVLDVAGIPVVAFSASQRWRTPGKRKTSGSSSKVTSEGTASASGATDVACSASSSQFQSELSYQSEVASTVSGESLIASDVLLLSTAADDVSDLEVLVDGLSTPCSSPVLVPESSSSLELEQLPVFPPFLQHHWLEKLD